MHGWGIVGILACVSLLIALGLDLAGIDKGHVNDTTFWLLGVLLLGCFLVGAWYRGWRQPGT
jgi:hypothetical protein